MHLRRLVKVLRFAWARSLSYFWFSGRLFIYSKTVLLRAASMKASSCGGNVGVVYATVVI